MAEENKSHAYETKVGDEGQSVETKDRGLFDLLGKKKEEKPQEDVIATEFEKVKVSEPEHKDEEKKPGLLEKLHRSDSSSCSSSDEEDDEETKKKKKEKKERKGLKEKIHEKFPGQKKHEDTSVPVEKYQDAVHTETEGGHPEDKKGFLEKIKEKLPSHQLKKTEDAHPHHPPAAEYSPTSTEAASHEAEAKEKKGFLDKIKEKLPGYHTKTEEEKEKEKEKESAAL